MLREIGSEEGVEEALRGEASQWQGRGRRISELEAEVERLKKLSSHSNKMFDSRLNSPDDVSLQPRDNGDGSSRQENLSRTGEEKDKGLSLNDVTQIWIIFDTPPSIVTLLIAKVLVLLSQNL